MKDLNIQIAIKIYEYEELNAADRELLDAARQATYRSYAPYSHFSVGAAAGWQTISSLPEPIRRMQLIRRGFARNAPLCSMPTPNIPTRLWRHLP